MRKKQQAKINLMQKISEKKFKEQQNKAQQIKIKMAASLMEAYAKGDKSICAKFDEEKVVESYCNKKFPGTPAQNLGCKVPEDFCFICCE